MMNVRADDLAHARAAFDAWRREHPRGRLPAHLWTLALELLERHPVTFVAKQLGLNQGRLRAKHRESNAKLPGSPNIKRSPFIELRPAALLPVATQVADPDPMRVEIERPDGTRFTVTIPSGRPDALDALVVAFLRAAP